MRLRVLESIHAFVAFAKAYHGKVDVPINA